MYHTTKQPTFPWVMSIEFQCAKIKLLIPSYEKLSLQNNRVVLLLIKKTTYATLTAYSMIHLRIALKRIKFNQSIL